MSGMGDGYVGTAQDVVRIRRLEKQREEFSSSTNEILETAFKKHQGAICSEGRVSAQVDFYNHCSRSNNKAPREGNHCADRLASHGTTISGFQWWDNTPTFIRNEFFRNRIDLSGYRFS